MELRPYQIEAVDSVFKNWKDGNKKTLLVAATGCHALGEKLLLANGKTTTVENIDVGTQLMGIDGSIRNVLAIHTGKKMMYEIFPIKGKPFKVTEDHVLTLVRTTRDQYSTWPSYRGGVLVDVTVKDYLNWSKKQKHMHKLFRSPGINFDTQYECTTFSVSPYFLGILLGDGGLKYSVSLLQVLPIL